MMTSKFTIEGRNTQLASQPWLGQQVVETPKKEININLNLAGASPTAAAAAVMAARMAAEDIPDYMESISCPQEAQMPALPEPVPAESSFVTKEDMMQAVSAAVTAAMKPLMAVSLEPMKLQKKQQLEAEFTAAVAAKSADAIKLHKQLASAEAAVDAATTAAEIAAVKL